MLELVRTMDLEILGFCLATLTKTKEFREDLISMDLVQQLEFLLPLLLISITMENKKIPEWFNVKCETIIEEIAPGSKCVKNALTGEVLAFMYENLDDDLTGEPDEQSDSLN